MSETNECRTFFYAVREFLGDDVRYISRDEILRVCEKYGLKYPSWFIDDPFNRVGLNWFIIPRKTEDNT